MFSTPVNRPTRHFWTNKSVLAFAASGDPEEAILRTSRELAFEAMERGWRGPPFDPFQLASLMGIEVVARDDLYDARTVPVPGGVRVEYNPNRPRARLRFSLAHELGHTLFPDCRETARHRGHEQAGGDGWQLEMLCNIAAGEILMPAGAFAELASESLDLENLIALRKKYEVSTEALLARMVKLTTKRAAVFAASRVDGESAASPFHVEYLRPSRTWNVALARGFAVPRDSVLTDCTAAGYTAQAVERWGSTEVRVQCLGLLPYPGQTFPRVAGLLTPRQPGQPKILSIEYVRGDATKPRGGGHRIIAHLVNDKTANWGGGFARALRSRWPSAQEAFQEWVGADRGRLALGKVHFADVSDDTTVATIIAQKGYGPSSNPRIRYAALSGGLASLANVAAEKTATVHLPRIGAGEAGGNWDVISELIDNEIVQRGIGVTVYTLPNAEIREPRQPSLPFAR
jgi:O-acetyl-ADP-ribose deacetylase (regulator of RNase III)